MGKRIVTLIVGILGAVGFSATPAFAWTYALSGSGACQPDGSYKITWTVDNTKENEALKVKTSSNTAVVPVGTEVPAGQTANFTETESGTSAPATYNLALDVTWPSDQNDHERTANVTLTQACAQPTPTPPPPTGGGMGGGDVTPVSTTPTVTTTPQVTRIPVAPVSAGEGGASTATNPLAVAGLIASSATGALGLRYRKLFSRGV